MPDMTGFLWFLFISGAVSAVFLNTGATGWLIQTISNILRPL